MSAAALATVACRLGFAGQPAAATQKTTMNIISGDLKSWRTLDGLAGLEAGMEFLEKTDLSALAVGKHQIDGDDLYAAVSRSFSRSPETGQFEAHRKYIDIQYLVAGAERIGVASATTLKVASPYSDADDVTFYSLPDWFEHIDLQPGRFVVFFPDDAHLPLCHVAGPQELSKVVIKVKVEHWQARRRG